MGIRRFHTRRQWHNTLIMAWVTPFLLLMGVILLAAAGLFWPLLVIGAGCVVGLLVAISRDLVNRCVYTVEEDRLVLEHGRERLEIRLADIADASLLDRAAAREYIRSRTRAGDPSKARERIRAFLGYCTVDIGLTSFTLGLGRGIIDRLPEAKHDLVLLRVRDQREFLLSPMYNQDLISAVTRFATSNLRRPGDQL
ncbi:MAG: hypothetical protein KIT10_00325 [Flavobacteriales bacterium]|nr:hypothetical protein [Flavobacteriales bacterium]